MRDRIDAAVIGLGWWGNELAEAIQSVDRLHLALGVSPVAAEREAFAERFGCAVAPDLSGALMDREIDAVLLATPHSQHADQVTATAAAGKHVFVEKPFTLTVESGLAAAAACSEAGVTLAVGHNRRLSAAAKRLKALHESGALGTVLHLEGHFSSPSALRYTPDMWRAQRSEAPGGGLVSMGLHIVDTIQWLFGPIVRTSCLTRRVAAPVDIDDVTTALFQFESGLTATLTSIFSTTLTAWLRVSTTNGVFVAGNDFTELTHRPIGDEPFPVPLTKTETVVEELRHFSAAVAGQGSVAVRSEDAIRNISVLEAMMSSAANNGAWQLVKQMA